MSVFVLDKNNISADHNTLLNREASSEEHIQAASNIIKNHDLPLNVEQLLQAFVYMRMYHRIHNLCILEYCLIFNKNMYVALILNYQWHFDQSCLISQCVESAKDVIFKIGASSESACEYIAYKHYCNMLDHYDFKVDALDMSKKLKNKIIEYRNSVWSGKLTKCAVK